MKLTKLNKLFWIFENIFNGQKYLKYLYFWKYTFILKCKKVIIYFKIHYWEKVVIMTQWYLKFIKVKFSEKLFHNFNKILNWSNTKIDYSCF